MAIDTADTFSNRSDAYMNSVTSEVIGAAMEVHQSLGPGLLESAYEECLAYELVQRGLSIQQQRTLPIVYKDVQLDHGYRLDMLVDQFLVLEIKTVEFLHDVHSAQILTYMRLGGYPLGLLMNFNVKLLKQGIKRFRI